MTPIMVELDEREVALIRQAFFSLEEAYQGLDEEEFALIQRISLGAEARWGIHYFAQYTRQNEQEPA